VKILYAEDDVDLNKVITSFLQLREYEVTSVYDGDSVLDKIENENFDLYILDINIPKINGLELIKFIRQKDKNIPVIIVTASLEIQNLMEAYDNGCNEYIKKPFHVKELEVRMNNLLNIDSYTVKLAEDLTFNTQTYDLMYQDNYIKLRKKVKRLLCILALNINKTVTNDMIEEFVWEGDIKESYPIRQLLKDLRKELPYELIKTEIGIGYKLETK
jgi:DNA-binding response OmpR family regulator